MSKQRTRTPKRPVPTPVTSQAVDALFKLAGTQLVAALPHKFSITVAPVERQLTTELPRVVLDLKRLDLLYKLTDGTGLNLECQMHLRHHDLWRFIAYGMILLQKGIVPRLLTVVFCGPDTGKLPEPIEIGPSAAFRMVFVRLVAEQAEAALARLQTTAAQGAAWTDTDRLDLVLLPLMPHTRDTESVIRDGLDVALQLPEAWQELAIGGLLAMAYHVEDRAVFNRLVDAMRGTTVLDKYLKEERLKGLEKGREEGLEKGREEGREEGLEKGREEARMMLRRVLLRRFGSIPTSLEARIAVANGDTLAALLDQALATTSVDDLLAR